MPAALTVREVRTWEATEPGTWRRDGDSVVVCIALPKGVTELRQEA